MSLNLNKVILAGRVASDPELKQTQSGVSVCSFRIAVNRRFSSRDPQQQSEADFFNVTAWQNLADIVARYFHKGTAICVCGRIQNRSWVDQNGQKRYMTDIIADEINFVESRNAQDNAPASASDIYATPAYSTSTPAAPKFEEIKTDDDLPF